MQYFVLPALVTATGMLAGAAPVNKEETGIQPLAPPATRPGAPLVLQWNPDVSGSQEWKHMTISLVSVSKDGHRKTTKLASNIDGTNPSKTNYTTEAPKHPQDSTVYFVQFSDGKSTKKSPEFTIENDDSTYHAMSRRHGQSETPGSVPSSELFSAHASREEAMMVDSVRNASPVSLNSEVQNGESVGDESLNDDSQEDADNVRAANMRSQQEHIASPVNIGGIMYIPLIPSGMLDIVRDKAQALPSQVASNNSSANRNSTSQRTSGGDVRNLMAHFEEMGHHFGEAVPSSTSSSANGHATQSLTASPESTHGHHSTETLTSTKSKPSHASSASHKTSGILNTESLAASQSSVLASLSSAARAKATAASPTLSSSSSAAGSQSSHGNLASELFNVPSMKKRSDMDNIISRIATVNSHVSQAFSKDASSTGKGNLTNTATGHGSSSTSGGASSTSGHSKSKHHHPSSTGHHHGNSTSSASASSSASSPTSSSNNTSSAQPTSGSSTGSGSSAPALSSGVLSSLASMSSSQIPEALSSLGMSSTASLFAGMDPFDGFRTTSHAGKAASTSAPSSSSSSSASPKKSSSSSSTSPSSSSSAPSSSSSSSSAPSSSSSSSSAPSSSSSSSSAPSSLSSSSAPSSSSSASSHKHHHSSASAKPTSASSGSMTRSRGSGTHSSGSQQQDNNMSKILAQGILSDTGLSPSQVSQYYANHGGQNHQSHHGSQGASSHGQGQMSASLHYKHGYQSVSQSF